MYNQEFQEHAHKFYMRKKVHLENLSHMQTEFFWHWK